MAYPTFTSAISTETSDTSTHDWTLPSGNSSGKLLVLIFFCDAQLVSVTTPSGFTLHPVSLDVGSTGGAQGRIFYKTTDGSETSGTITTSGNEKSVTVSLLITGARTTEFADARIGGTDQNPNPPSLSADNGADTILWIAVAGTSATSENANSWTLPTGYTAVQRGNSGTADATDVQLAVAYKNATAGSENPGTFTIVASNQWMALTLAFEPEPTPSQALPPVTDSLPFYNDFIGNFGISSSFLNHANVLTLLSALRPSGNILQNDPSIAAASDPDYLKIKVLSPNSGTVYERIEFRPTQMENHFVHLASGLTLDMRYDSITTNSGIMEVWLDASGLGYLNSNQRWWYSGPIGLPSGMDQTISVSKQSLYPVNLDNFNNFANITIDVKYHNSGNTQNELNIYSMKLCGDHAFSPISITNTTSLVTIGGAPDSGNIPLYTYGLVRDSGNIPLFINGWEPESGVIPLTIISASSISSGIPLFIRGGIATNMNLFLKTYDPVGRSGIMPMSIWGITDGSGNLFKTTTLYTDGTASPSGAMNLFIGGYEDPINITSNMNLFLRAFGEYNASGEVIQVTTNNMPLSIYNNTIYSGMSLYLDAQTSLPYSGNMNLVMWRNGEGLSHVMPMTLIGPSGTNEDLTLFLHAQPNYRDNMTMFVSGIAEQVGNISCYTHGF